jgi:hypothetical protein
MGIFRSANRVMQLFGIDVSRTITATKVLPGYWRQLGEFKRMLEQAKAPFSVTKLYPCLFDKHEESGTRSSQYFLQDLYVANRVFKSNPRHHVDVGSRIDGFVAHVASFRELEVFDVRPLSAPPFHVKFRQVDLTRPDLNLEGYCDSVSCLHALEHFGLGRYGDPLDADGHIKGLANLHRMLTPKGTLYLSGPIGPQRIEFNAHRVFSVEYLLEMFSGRFEVVRFTLIHDSGRFFPELELDSESVAGNFGCHYGCGIFELQKI